MEDKELKDLLNDKIAKDYQRFFIKGIMTGWQSCAKTLYKKCSGLTSAKAIKEALKEEVDRIIDYDITNNDKENND